jgi:hypothetical protein
MGVNEGTGLADMASGGHVQLVGDSSALAEGWVKVPAVPIHAFRPEFGGMRTVGRYAYWVGDEGIKADIGVIEPAAGDPADEAEEMRGAAAREMRRVLAPGQAGGRAIFPGMDTHHADWDRVLTATQWGWPSGDSSINASAARARFHDASVQIRGLLTHTAAPAGNGGLKRDLSRGLHDTGLPPTLVGLGEARAGAPPGWGERSYPLGAVEVDATLYPIIAEVRLRFAVRIDETSRDLQLVPGLSLALYNPYTVFLGTQPLRYELEVSGLPNLADGELTVNGVAVDLNLPEVAGGVYRTAPVAIPPGATILIGGGFEDQAPRWQNGVLRDWTDRVARDAEPITLASAMPISAEGDRIELLTRAGSLDLRLSVWRPGEDQATALAAWSFTYAADEGPLVGDEEIRFGFRAAVDDRDPENWLERDIRATPPVLLPAVAWSAPEAAEAMVSAGPDTDPGYVLFGNNRSERYTLLFEVPRRGVPLMSLGQLQHAYWPGQPAWSLGSAAAVDINREILDRYYFSTIPDHWSEAAWRRGDALPNARMLPVDWEDAQTTWLNSDRAATALMVRGMFNLNSTSHRAWAAVLRSSSGWNPMILDPTSAIADPDYLRARFSLTDRATPYTAFPKFAAGLGFYDLRPTAHLNHSQPHQRSLWQTGHRELKPLYLDESAVNAAGGTATTRDFSEANANALVLRLADNLVRRIRAQGRPFASLADFANAGLLQDVIDNATAPFWSWHATAADATTPEGALATRWRRSRASKRRSNTSRSAGSCARGAVSTRAAGGGSGTGVRGRSSGSICSSPWSTFATLTIPAR